MEMALCPDRSHQETIFTEAWALPVTSEHMES